MARCILEFRQMILIFRNLLRDICPIKMDRSLTRSMEENGEGIRGEEWVGSPI